MRAAMRTLLLLVASLLVTALLTGGVARAESCPNGALRAEQGVQEGAAHSLPACRAYELASPPLKNEQEVNVPDRFVREISFQAAEQGGAVQYTLTGAIPGSESGGLYGDALSRSGAPGASWETMPLEPDNHFDGLHGAGEVAGEFLRFSPQLGCGLEETRLPLPPFSSSEAPQLAPGESAEEDVENLYEWNAADEYTLITNIKPSDPALTSEGPVYYVDGASSDCKTVLFGNTQPGYAQPETPEGSLYEWNEGESAASCRKQREEAEKKEEEPTVCQPQLASVLPDGKSATTVVEPEGGENRSDLNELSSDGSRLFFSAASDGGGAGEAVDAGAVQIYLREDGQTQRAISLSQTATPVRDTGAKFEAASREGERVFFVANYGLTGKDGTSGPTSCILISANSEKDENNGAGTGCDLYEYVVGSGVLNDVSSDATDANGADMRGVLGIAENGSAVYFSATGQLVPGQGNTAAQDEATTGTSYTGAQKTESEANVYGNYEGSLHYVATIGETEAGGFNAGPGHSPFFEVDAISASKGMHYDAARVSENGQYLMLATRYPLSAYNNTQAETLQPEWEEYEYSRPGASLSCVSCNPTGEAPVADSNEQFSALGVYIANQDGVIPRSVANDGRVFFDSAQPLQSTVGGTSFTAANKAVNVYEWTPEGVLGCAPPSAPETAPVLHGCLGLIDSGTEAEKFPTYFEGASVGGEDVYITTHAALAPQDQDGLNEIYDVRTDGGIAAPTPPAECTAELQSCQPSGPGLTTGTYASESALGGGNLANPGVVKTAPAIVSAPVPKVKSSARHTVKGTSVTVSVTVAVAGRITVSGAGFETLARSVSKAGVYKLTAVLSAKERKQLERKHRVRLTLHVAFAPGSGESSSSATAVTFT